MFWCPWELIPRLTGLYLDIHIRCCKVSFISLKTFKRTSVCVIAIDVGGLPNLPHIVNLIADRLYLIWLDLQQCGVLFLPPVLPLSLSLPVHHRSIYYLSDWMWSVLSRVKHLYIDQPRKPLSICLHPSTACTILASSEGFLCPNWKMILLWDYNTMNWDF